MLSYTYPSFDFAKGQVLYIPNDFSNIKGWFVSQSGIKEVCSYVRTYIHTFVLVLAISITLSVLSLLCMYIYVTGFAKMGFIHVIINIWKHDFKIF